LVLGLARTELDCIDFGGLNFGPSPSAARARVPSMYKFQTQIRAVDCAQACTYYGTFQPSDELSCGTLVAIYVCFIYLRDFLPKSVIIGWMKTLDLHVNLLF